MRGFQPGKARAVPQNYADGGVVSAIKGMLGFGGSKKKPEPLPADLNKMPPTGAGPAASQPEQPKKAISQYSGMSALERRMKEQGLADGGLVRGPGTGISDDIEDDVEEGTFIMPADSTEAIGPEVMDQAGKAVPVRLSNGEAKLPPEALQAIGAEVMEAIKEVTHTPAAKQARVSKPAADDGREGFADGGMVKKDEQRIPGVTRQGNSYTASTIADRARLPGYGGGAAPQPVAQPVAPVRPPVTAAPAATSQPAAPATTSAQVVRDGNSFSAAPAQPRPTYTGTTLADRARQPGFAFAAASPTGMALTRPAAQPATAPAQAQQPATTIASQVQKSGNSYSAAPAQPKPSGPAYPSHPDMPTSSTDGVGKAFGAIGDGLKWLGKTAISAPGYGLSKDAAPKEPDYAGRGAVNPANVDPSAPRPTSTVQTPPQGNQPDPKNPDQPNPVDAANPDAREISPGIYRQGNSYGDSPEAAATGARPSQGPSTRNNSIAEALATRSTGQQGQPTDVMGIYARTSEAMKGVADAQRALDEYGPRMSGGGDLALGGRASAQQFQQDMQRTALMKQAAQGGRGGAAAMQALNNMDGNQIQRETAQMREQGDTARFNAREAGETTRAGMRSQADARRDGLAAELGRGQLDLQRSAQGLTSRQAERREKYLAEYEAAETPEARATIAQKIRDTEGKVTDPKDNFMVVGGGQEWDEKAGAMRNVPQRLIDLRTGQDVGGGRKQGASQPPKNHIDALKADPKLAAQFDDQYGPGASKQYIGG